MIELNGKKLAQTKEEFQNSVFVPGGSCVGYAKKFRKSVLILDSKGERVGVINKYGVLGSATKHPTLAGKWWYSYATIKIIGEWSSYSRQKDEVQAAYEKIVGSPPACDYRK